MRRHSANSRTRRAGGVLPAGAAVLPHRYRGRKRNNMVAPPSLPPLCSTRPIDNGARACQRRRQLEHFAVAATSQSLCPATSDPAPPPGRSATNCVVPGGGSSRWGDLRTNPPTQSRSPACCSSGSASACDGKRRMSSRTCPRCPGWLRTPRSNTRLRWTRPPTSSPLSNCAVAPRPRWPNGATLVPSHLRHHRRRRRVLQPALRPNSDRGLPGRGFKSGRQMIVSGGGV